MRPDGVRRWSFALLLLLLPSGCASVRTAETPKKVPGPPTMKAQAPVAAQIPIALAAWPGEVVHVAKGSVVMLDAFEGLLVQAGIDTLDQLPARERPLDREGATRLLALLLEKPLPLRSFPQRMGACFLLKEVLNGGAVSRDELNRRVDRFRQVVVLRPDGYLAWVLSGHTQQRAGPGPVEFKDGVFKANGFVLGQFYSGRTGAYRPVDAQMRPLGDSTILGEVYDDGDLFGRAMDGAEEAFFSLAMAVGKFLSRPLDGIAALKDLPAGVAALIASSPAYLERFKLMTTGEQVQAVSRLSTMLLTTFAGGGAVSASVTRGLGGMEVASLSLSAEGTLALGRVVVPAGQVATVLVAGVGFPIILQATAVAGNGVGTPGKAPADSKAPGAGTGQTQGHHSFPKALGGHPDQKLSALLQDQHIGPAGVHADLAKFEGGWLYPKPGMTGARIVETYGRERVIEGLRRFYSQPKWRFLLADFEAAVKFTLEAQ